MTPWIISFVIALLLIQAAIKNKNQANDSSTAEGTALGVILGAIFTIAALAFILVTVVLAGS